MLPLSGGADSSATAAIVGCMTQLVTKAVASGDKLVEADARRLDGTPCIAVIAAYGLWVRVQALGFTLVLSACVRQTWHCIAVLVLHQHLFGHQTLCNLSQHQKWHRPGLLLD